MTRTAVDPPVDEITLLPANHVPCEDLMAVFGTGGSSAVCFCQRYKLMPGEAFSKFPREERAAVA